MPWVKRTSWMSIVCLIMILGVVGSILLLAAVPPVSRDALTHHLAVPKLWIEHGGIYEIPHLTFGYYPMNLDLLYVIPLLMGNDIAPKYIHFMFGLATAWLIYAYLRKRTTFTYALLGALIFLSTPVIVKLSISVYVDLGLIFFSWAAMYCLFNWQQSPANFKYLLLAAVFCGLCMGTKYNGLLIFFLLTLCVSLLATRNVNGVQPPKPFKTLLQPLLFVFVAVVIFSPWMIKNVKWTGNPIYPLYNKVFSVEADGNPGQYVSMKPWLQRKLIYRETALETALIPVRIFFQGQDDNPKYFDGRLNPILFFFPLIAFFKLKKLDNYLKSELVVLGSFSILYLLYASFIVDMRIRYIAPIIPPLVILTVIGIKETFSFVEHRGNLFKLSLISVVSMLLVLNFYYLKDLFLTVEPVAYLRGTISRVDYIEKFRPEYPLIQTANHLSGEKVKLLAMFLGKRSYYFKKDVEFAKETFRNAIEKSGSAEKVATELSSRGFTHAIVGIGLFKQWAERVFERQELVTINQFFAASCKPVAKKNGYALFEILDTTNQ